MKGTYPRRAERTGGLFGSMRLRIVAAVVLLLAASAVVSTFFLRSVLLERLDEEITQRLRDEADEFELLAGGNDPRTGRPFGSDVRALFNVYFDREIPDERETLLTFVGDELYRSERAQFAADPDRLTGAIQYWLSLEERTLGRIGTDAGEARYIALPLGPGGRDGLFVAANFPGAEQREIDGDIGTQALTQLVTILLASLVGLGLAGRVLKPLRLLTDTAQTITATDLTQRIPVAGRDEASRIAETFNDMLERLEAVVAAQRQFLDDASHELRVPLTVIRGNVEVLELESDPAERAAMIQLITDEIDRMSRIVEDLLLLARAERPDFLTLESVDLGGLMADIHRKAAVLCRRDWQLTETAQTRIRGDGQRLTQAMMQLAQNVCQHTEEGSRVRIGSRIVGDQIVLWVHDTGPGVAPEDMDRVFERYVRGADRPAGSGLGLGLTIVAAIATAHGGGVRLANEARPGARFEITLPLAGPIAAAAKP
jgi:two-component system OmpR family sensor kinase